MKKIDTRKAISILTNVGVIAGIVFLGFELQQNNELMAQQQRFNRLSLATSTNVLLIENPGVAALMVKSAQGLEGLTSTELQQVQAFESRILQAQEWSFLELPRQDLHLRLWKNNSKRDGWRRVWALRKADLDPTFVEFMEQEVIGD